MSQSHPPNFPYVVRNSWCCLGLIIRGNDYHDCLITFVAYVSNMYGSNVLLVYFQLRSHSEQRVVQ